MYAEGPQDGLWVITFFLKQCKYKKLDLLTLSYDVTLPNEKLFGIVKANREVEGPEGAKCSHLEVQVRPVGPGWRRRGGGGGEG